MDLAPNAKYPLHLIEADLQNPESWAKAVESCSYVFHIASPIPPSGAISPQDEEEKVIRPAVDGTINILQACADAGTVKRVVLTSSLVAACYGPELPPDHLYSEADWSEGSLCTGYVKSKTLAEKAAWNFMTKSEKEKEFELVVLNPGYVQGPLLSRASGASSMELCLANLTGYMVAIPDIPVPLVDVRDVVTAHIAALNKPEVAGKRFLLVTDTINMRVIAQIISEEFKPQGYRVSTLNLPKFIVWIGKFFSADFKEMYNIWGKNFNCSREKMIGELGVTPQYSIKETLLDTCYKLIDLGEVKKTRGYLGHPSTRPPPLPKE